MTQAKLSSLLFPDLGTPASAQVLKSFDLLLVAKETIICFSWTSLPRSFRVAHIVVGDQKNPSHSLV